MEKQRKISILGDSYSTFEGWIPKDYEAWYGNPLVEDPGDIDAVEQLWWYRFCEAKNYKMLWNCSYAGSTICNTGYEPEWEEKISFITRMQRELGPQQEQKADVLIIFGGTNDFWIGSPLGDVQYEGWTSADLKRFAPAFCYMMHRLKEWNPNTVIYNVVNDVFSDEWKTVITEVCEHYHIVNVELQDIEKQNRHPNRKGMRQIVEQIAEKVI